MNNQGKTKPGELLFILSQFCPTILMWVYGFKPIAISFTIWTFFILFQEWFWDTKTGKTMSQHYWSEGKRKKVGAVLIAVSMAIQFNFLVIHLIVPVFKK